MRPPASQQASSMMRGLPHHCRHRSLLSLLMQCLLLAVMMDRGAGFSNYLNSISSQPPPPPPDDDGTDKNNSNQQPKREQKQNTNNYGVAAGKWKPGPRDNDATTTTFATIGSGEAAAAAAPRRRFIPQSNPFLPPFQILLMSINAGADDSSTSTSTSSDETQSSAAPPQSTSAPTTASSTTSSSFKDSIVNENSSTDDNDDDDSASSSNSDLEEPSSTTTASTSYLSSSTTSSNSGSTPTMTTTTGNDKSVSTTPWRSTTIRNSTNPPTKQPDAINMDVLNVESDEPAASDDSDPLEYYSSALSSPDELPVNPNYFNENDLSPTTEEDAIRQRSSFISTDQPPAPTREPRKLDFSSAATTSKRRATFPMSQKRPPNTTTTTTTRDSEPARTLTNETKPEYSSAATPTKRRATFPLSQKRPPTTTDLKSPRTLTNETKLESKIQNPAPPLTSKIEKNVSPRGNNSTASSLPQFTKPQSTLQTPASRINNSNAEVTRIRPKFSNNYTILRKDYNSTLSPIPQSAETRGLKQPPISRTNNSNAELTRIRPKFSNNFTIAQKATDSTVAPFPQPQQIQGPKKDADLTRIRPKFSNITMTGKTNTSMAPLSPFAPGRPPPTQTRSWMTKGEKAQATQFPPTSLNYITRKSGTSSPPSSPSMQGPPPSQTMRSTKEGKIEFDQIPPTSPLNVSGKTGTSAFLSSPFVQSSRPSKTQPPQSRKAQAESTQIPPISNTLSQKTNSSMPPNTQSTQGSPPIQTWARTTEEKADSVQIPPTSNSTSQKTNSTVTPFSQSTLDPRSTQARPPQLEKKVESTKFPATSDTTSQKTNASVTPFAQLIRGPPTSQAQPPQTETPIGFVQKPQAASTPKNPLSSAIVPPNSNFSQPSQVDSPRRAQSAFSRSSGYSADDVTFEARTSKEESRASEISPPGRDPAIPHVQPTQAEPKSFATAQSSADAGTAQTTQKPAEALTDVSKVSSTKTNTTSTSFTNPLDAAMDMQIDMMNNEVDDIEMQDAPKQTANNEADVYGNLLKKNLRLALTGGISVKKRIAMERPEPDFKTKGMTERIMSRMSTDSQASDTSTWEGFMRAEAKWARLRGINPSKDDFGRDPFVVENDIQKGNPECIAKLFAQKDTKFDYDVVVCGGNLGIFFATALQLRGHNVCVVELNALRGREQEWNIGYDEVMQLVYLGVLSLDDLDAAIQTEFPGCRAGFKNKEMLLKDGYSENGIGFECFVEGVQNIGVSPAILIERVSARFRELGGEVREYTPVNNIFVASKIGAVLDIGYSEEPITTNLIIDAMGDDSPITRQQRHGIKPDGVCVMVGTCAGGFDPKTNLFGDVIYTNRPIQDKGTYGKLQYFWESYPVGIGPNGKAPGTSDVKTTYMFTYMDADRKRPKLESLMEDYWRLLPHYQPSIENPELDLDVKRVLFDFFPTYKDSPLPAGFDRILAVGDASGIQSPLSRGSLGTLARHLDRISEAITEAVDYDMLTKEDLSAINFYAPNLSASWIYQRAISIKRGKWPLDPRFVNRFLATNLEVMHKMGPRTLKPFLQNVIRFDGLVGTMARTLLSDLTFAPKVVSWVGFPALIDFMVHVGMMGVYGALDTALSPLLRPVGDKTFKNARIRYYLHRKMDAWKYGSGNDYDIDPLPRK